MRATCWFFGWGIALSLWAATPAVAAEDPEPRSDACVIRVSGSLPLADSVEQLGKWFAKEHPGSVTAVTGGGMRAAFEGLSENQTDIVMAWRRARPSETSLAAGKGVRLEERLIGSAAVTVFVNPQLGVEQLTLDQLKKIYKGEIEQWNAVGGPAMLIEPVSLPDSPRGPAGWFRSNVMESAEFGPRTEFVKDPMQVVKRVASVPASIGYMGSIVLAETLATDKDIRVTVIKLAAASDASALLPSLENIRDGAYPLTRSLYFYWDSRSTNRGVPTFVDYCVTRAAHLQ